MHGVGRQLGPSPSPPYRAGRAPATWRTARRAGQRGLPALPDGTVVANHAPMGSSWQSTQRLTGAIVGTMLICATALAAAVPAGSAGAAPATGPTGVTTGVTPAAGSPLPRSEAHCSEGGQCGGGPQENSPNQLDGVSCATSAHCVAVGSYYDITRNSRLALIEAWDGTGWVVVPSPVAGPASELAAVSCVGTAYCVAVGSFGPGQPNSFPDGRTLVEVWHGGAWTVVPSADTGSPENVLRGVSCTSPTFCMAVGESGDPTVSTQTLTERWDGTAWSLASSPSPGARANTLAAVSCSGPTMCMAAGVSAAGSPGEDTLAVRWNGVAWSQVPSPSPAPSSQLSGVACPSATSCVAVGSQGDSSALVYRTLAESWNGSSWTVVPSPSDGPALNFLSSVACVSATDCTAVGHWVTGGTESEFRTLVETWNGVGWAFVPSPRPATSGGVFVSAVSCATPVSCMAVGDYGSNEGEELTLAMSFDGSAWSIVGTPNVRVLLAPTVGMAATPSGDGYWLADSAGDLSTHGVAVDHGSMGGQPLNAPVTHLVATRDGKGYWLVAADGGIFSFGDARFFGSMGGTPLNAPVVGLTPTPSGHGYWLVASDGGVFSFGDAAFAGSMGGAHLNQPVVGIATDRATGGYWLVAADGGIFSFAAPFLGSTGGIVLNRPVVSMAATDDGGGYWLVAGDGGMFAYGSAGFLGSMGGQALNAPVVGMAADDATGGYWLVASDGGGFSFGAPFLGAG